jgi:catechol 2,3-dioxygenase-like lactoylglutathione lyase family enzyme
MHRADHQEIAMSRVQLALNVDDVDAAVAFYSKLFRAAPAKRRPGYANFALTKPALKLVLVESPGRAGSINHLGIEVASTTEVAEAARRLADDGLETLVEDSTTCCYAVQDKVWVTAPGGERWEVYTVLADAGTELEGKAVATERESAAVASGAVGGCCGSPATSPAEAEGQVCCAG